MPISSIDSYSAMAQPPEQAVGAEEISREPPTEEDRAAEQGRPPDVNTEARSEPPPSEEYKGQNVDTYA